MSKRSLIVIGLCWAVALAVLVWMFANDFTGALMAGLFSGVVATPLYVAKELWWPRKPS